jgi:hypothetical protein
MFNRFVSGMGERKLDVFGTVMGFAQKLAGLLDGKAAGPDAEFGLNSYLVQVAIAEQLKRLADASERANELATVKHLKQAQIVMYLKQATETQAKHNAILIDGMGHLKRIAKATSEQAEVIVSADSEMRQEEAEKKKRTDMDKRFAGELLKAIREDIQKKVDGAKDAGLVKEVQQASVNETESHDRARSMWDSVGTWRDNSPPPLTKEDRAHLYAGYYPSGD